MPGINLFQSISSPTLFGFTIDQTGANLPPKMGPWQGINGEISIESFRELFSDLPGCERVLRAIHEEGFFLTKRGDGGAGWLH
jgi:hypothetical protein